MLFGTVTVIDSTVKLFLKKPSQTKGLVQKVLHLATESSDNPDLRDRGYVYWRLLSTDPSAARKVVLAERPLISSETDRFPTNYLSSLLENISSLASVYHCKPNEFVKDNKSVSFMPFDESESDTDTEISSSSSDVSDDSDTEAEVKEAEILEVMPDLETKGIVNDCNIMDTLVNVPVSSAPVQSHVSLSTVFDANKGDGLEMRIAFERKDDVPTTIVQCCNKGNDIITRIDIKFNRNYLGIQPTHTLPLEGNINRGQTQLVDVPLILCKNMIREHPLDLMVQMAARCIRKDVGKVLKPAKVPL
eukprot:TRINITY_DN456_c0_g1_i1.p1 TRINITY_DN456_c0_g1~~TRINITY_DN456_c0_g1_i1.p1  ORF type:complete len:304 (+),score=98.32 TRINITY_DN456_c0_g1_i1:191-1102(+)